MVVLVFSLSLSLSLSGLWRAAGDQQLTSTDLLGLVFVIIYRSHSGFFVQQPAPRHHPPAGQEIMSDINKSGWLANLVEQFLRH